MTGSDGLSIGCGDLIQTRKNSTDLGVANRQQWIVQRVDQDGSLWVREAHSGRKRERSLLLPAEYVREHTHLSYATTAYGVQGITVPASHTVLSDGMSGAAVYVGMTRGRASNILHVVAENLADARAQFIDAMERDHADRGLTDATARAAEAVRGLVADGPVKLVNDEIARLMREAQRAEARAGMWERITERVGQQRGTHKAEDEQSVEVIRAAETNEAHARAAVVAELLPHAAADGDSYLTAVANQDAATARLATVGRFGRRRARQEHETATTHTQATRVQVTDTWDSTPGNRAGLTEWATQAAGRRAEHDPRVTAAARTLMDAQAERAVLEKRHDRERLALLAEELGADTVRRDPVRAHFIHPEQEAQTARAQATAAHREAEELRTLTPREAATLIETKRAAAERARELAAERARRLRGTPDHTHAEPNRHGPSLGL